MDSATPLPVPAPWTGVLLAGGRSSRMGQDKARLVWRGMPLIEHMRALLLEAGAARVAISGCYPEYGAVPDAVPALGPLGGLHSLAATEPDGTWLVVPVDMPRLAASTLHRLLAAPAAACACYHGRPLPMRLRLDADSRRTLAALASASGRGRSLRALHAALGGIELAIGAGDEDGLANVNTPEQWQELIK